MKLAMHLSNIAVMGDRAGYGEKLAGIARAADEGGCSALTVMDHWFQMENLGGPEQPMLEAYTTLGYMAACTSRVQLGALVTGVTYRHPGLLAKIVATLDVISGGRGFLGIGAAWYDREHEGLGVPFPSISERFERLDETLAVCQQMWSDDNGPFDGRYYQLAETYCEPRPLTQPRPRILIGGSGERKTLPLVARYADACNLFTAEGPEGIARKLGIIAEHCRANGRDPAEVQGTILFGYNPAEDPDGFVSLMSEYARVGISQVWITVKGEDPAAWVTEVCDKVVDRLAEL
jgi:F420-dependent oxidoreductase-like protein